MKNIFFSTIFISFLLVVGSCKNDKSKEASVEEAREVATSEAEATEFVVDTAASVIDWKGSKPTGTHTGTIKIAEGSFRASDSEIESGNFIIDVHSIDVMDLKGKDKTDLEAHLKGTVEGKEGDFFNANEYPEATFEITDLSEENGETILSGNLTIKEDTKNISFPVSIDRSEDEIQITSDRFTIDRTNWSVNFGSRSVFDGLGDNFVHDDVELRLNIKANKA